MRELMQDGDTYLLPKLVDVRKRLLEGDPVDGDLVREHPCDVAPFRERNAVIEPEQVRVFWVLVLHDDSHVLECRRDVGRELVESRPDVVVEGRRLSRHTCHAGMLRLADRVEAMPTFASALNEQIRHEFSASQQYIAVAVYYESQSLPQLAAHFYRQAVEERNHAMIMVQYLLDADEDVVTPGIDAPKTQFEDVVDPVSLALAQEKRVTEQIIELVKLAREEGELVGEQFLHWFLQEQREEVASMTELLAVVERGKENLLSVEEYLSRSAGGANPLEAGAPPAAGGAL